MALSEIVNVTIQAGTVNPARRGFGVPLLLFFHTVWAGDEVRSYTSFGGFTADFTDINTAVYKAAAAIFSQNPRPEKIKVARLPTPGSQQVVIFDGTDYDLVATITGSVVSPDGTATTISVAFNTNLATTMTDLATALAAITGLGAVSDATSVTADADNNGEFFFFSMSTPGVDIRETTLDWDYDDRLTNSVLLVDPEFYGVLVESASPVNIDKLARWALANDRLYGTGPQYTKPAQFVSGEFTSGADHTALLANDSAFGLFTKEPRSSFKECAWLAEMFPKDPGSATWAFKQLSGVGADTWTATERTTIEDAIRSGNHYAAEATIGITRPGKAFGGEFLDVVRGLAWLQARIEERIFTLFVNNDKVPYTDEGLNLIRAEVLAQLQEAEDRGVLVEGASTVTVLAAAAQATADRTARIVRGIEFQAALAGAVHKAFVVGTVTV